MIFENNRTAPALFQEKVSHAKGTAAAIKKIAKCIKSVGNSLRSLSSGLTKKSRTEIAPGEIKKNYMAKVLNNSKTIKDAEKDAKCFKQVYQQTMASVFSSRKDEVLSLLRSKEDVLSYRKEIGELAQAFDLDVKADNSGVLVPAGEGTSALANLIKNSAYKKFDIRPDKLHNDAMKVIEDTLDNLCRKQSSQLKTLTDFNNQLRDISAKYTVSV
ncbi:TPA: hypothetical protein SMF55_004845 [Serratia liquefaciens]|nr:hypothetical protein [Serratia liquefaciens]